jgi:type IV fimbrial biogenesis protein FimT
LECTNGSGWQNGWLIFSDGGTAGIIDGDDEVLRVFPPLQGGALTASSNFSNSISYLASGRSRGNGNLLGNGSFMVCSHGKKNEISIITAGRPSLRKGQTC